MNTTLKTFGLFAVTGLFATSASAGLVVTNGDFESPDIAGGAQIQDVPGWFDSGVGDDYTSWHLGEQNDPQTNGTQMLAFGPGNGDAYVYQSLGTMDSDGGTLDWSLDQTRFADGNASAGVVLRFYYGNAAGADNTDISTLGLTQIGSDVTINAFGISATGTGSQNHTGTLDLTGLSAGTQVWIELDAFTDAGWGFGPYDNISVSHIPEPSSLALLGLGGLAVVSRRRK